jgi:hypothetical protein
LLIYLLYHLLISLSCSLSLLLSSCWYLLLNLSLINWRSGSLLLWLTLHCTLRRLFNGLLRLCGSLFDHGYLIIVLLNFALINLSLLSHLLLSLGCLNLHTSSCLSLILLSLYILLSNLIRSWRLNLLICSLDLCVCLWLIFVLSNDFISKRISLNYRLTSSTSNFWSSCLKECTGSIKLNWGSYWYASSNSLSSTVNGLIDSS